MPLYFAYGSNMDQAAMLQRCPASKPVGIGRLMRHRFIIFEEGYASVVRDPQRAVWGMVWDLALVGRAGPRPLREPLDGPLQQGRAAGRDGAGAAPGRRLYRTERQARHTASRLHGRRGRSRTSMQACRRTTSRASASGCPGRRTRLRPRKILRSGPSGAAPRERSERPAETHPPTGWTRRTGSVSSRPSTTIMPDATGMPATPTAEDR